MRFFYKLGQSPVEGFELLQYLVLTWILFQTLAGFGGFLGYSRPMVDVSRALIVLAGLHALVILFRKRRPGPWWLMALPLPFLACSWLHYRFLSPAPWEAALFLTVYVQAYALYLIILNSINRPRAVIWVLGIGQGIALIALLAGFFQFYQFPEWMVTLERERHPGYLSGAAGFLLDPVNLGGLLMLFWPASILLAGMRRFPGPVRLLNGSLAVAMLVGLMLSAHREGIVLAAVLLFLLPFFISDFGRSRWKAFRILLGGVLAGLPMFFFGSDILRERLLNLVGSSGDTAADASVRVAWTQFLERPLLGHGLGSFDILWEGFRPEGTGEGVRYAVSAYAGFLAEFGLLGVLCLGLPAAWLFVRGLRAWRAAPFISLDRDSRQRMERLPKGHPARRQMERKGGKTPLEKVILGAMLTGLGGFLVYVAWDYSLKLPLFIFLLAILLAVLGTLAFGEAPVSRRRSWRGLATGLVPLVLTVLAAVFGVPRFESQYLVYTTDERLAYLLEEPDRIFFEPAELTLALQAYSGAARLNPEHAGAWTGIGRSWLARLHADLWEREELAAEALPALERALQESPSLWVAHHETARALAILEPGSPAVGRHARRAVELAPHRPEPQAFLDGLQRLRRADPGRDGEAQGLTEPMLAERHPALGTAEERILAAGVMPPPEDPLVLSGPE
ncbi:MAG: hypothetical protein R6V45_07365 [Oceanipulchritudo sp.]